MRLIDQTNIQRFFLLMYGPQPVAGAPEEARGSKAALENEAWFPRVKELPAEVESPRGFPKRFGLVAALRVEPTSGHVLGSLLPVQEEEGMSRRLRPLWCVWDRKGSLLHAFEALDAVWAEHGLLTLAWSDSDESSDYILELRDPESFQSLQNARFVVAANAERASDLWLSAETLAPVGKLSYWAVQLADGQGETAFDVFHVTDDRILRVYTRGVPPVNEDPQPYGPVLRPDEQWLAYATWAKRGADRVHAVGLVDLHTGAEQVHPVLADEPIAVDPEKAPLELAFESAALRVAIGPWRGSFDPAGLTGEPWRLARGS